MNVRATTNAILLHQYLRRRKAVQPEYIGPTSELLGWILVGVLITFAACLAAA